MTLTVTCSVSVMLGSFILPSAMDLSWSGSPHCASLICSRKAQIFSSKHAGRFLFDVTVDTLPNCNG